LKRLLYIVPILAFGVLAYVLFASLNGPPPDQLPSALVDKPAPPIALPPLDADSKSFNRSDLTSGHVTVMNVWLKSLDGVALYGLVYKDQASRARAFLSEVGNPFSRLDLDLRGRAAIDWGVYDVPETFVINGKGIVRLRYSGPITEDVLKQTVLPAIEQARRQS
jgi:cytochrome c biogenesis protein CcmG, thiol:disulfide interchange protein DsbE